MSDHTANIMAGLICLIVLALMIVIIVSGAMDTSSEQECIFLGYDGGDQLFWQGMTVCWDIIQPEKREYFFLERR